MKDKSTDELTEFEKEILKSLNLNLRVGKEKRRDCYRIRTYDDKPEKIWEGDPTHWVTLPNTKLIAIKFANEFGRPVLLQRRRCISKPTPEPPQKSFKPDVKEIILLDEPWEDYGQIIYPDRKKNKRDHF